MSVSLHLAEPIPDQDRLRAIVDEVVVGDAVPTKEWVLRLDPEHRVSDDTFAALRMLMGTLSDDATAFAFRTLPLTLTCGLELARDHVCLFRRGSPWSDDGFRAAHVSDAQDTGIALHADGGDWRRAAHRSCARRDLLERVMRQHDVEEVRLARAAALIDLGQFHDALDTLGSVGTRAAKLRAHALMRCGRPAQALHALFDADEPLLEAQARLQLRQSRRAKATLQFAASIDVHAFTTIDELNASTLLAELDFLDGDIDAADRAARVMTSKRPDHGAAWFLLFDVLRARRQHQQLEKLITQLQSTPGAEPASEVMETALGGRAKNGGRLADVVERRRAHASKALLSCLSFPWLLDARTGEPLRESTTPKVSLTMIVRDEEKNLGECLAGVVDLVDEVVIVDTGSRDRTRAIAEHFGASCAEFPWCDDFAAARNAALDHARGEWMFILDADDRILQRDHEKLQALMARLPDDGGHAFCLNRVSLAEDGQVASELEQVLLFRRHSEVRWEYRVHEQITPALLRRATSFTSTGIRVIHTGYRDAETLKAKSERNFRIVQKDLVDRPDDPFLNFSYGMMLVDHRRHAEALEPLKRAVATTEARTEMARSLAIALTRCLLAAGREDEALTTIHASRVENPGHAAVALAEAEILVGRGELDGATEALAELPFDAKAKFDMHHARALMLLGELMIQRRDYAKAEAIGRALTTTRPSFAGGWHVATDAYVGLRNAAAIDELGVALRPAREADSTRAIMAAARRILAGDAKGAAAVVEAARSTAHWPLLDVVAGRVDRREPPFATCAAAPWTYEAKDGGAHG